MKNIIEGSNITKIFGTGDEAQSILRDVSVTIGESEFVAVMGPSGSGKTTLMFALSGMDEIDAGQVLFDGQDISKLSESALADLRRQRMGFVFQQPTLLKNLSIIDNIILAAQRGNEMKASELMEKAQRLMEQVGISELAQRDISQASGGQLQRAGICRALMGGPDIVFGDEPTGALNSKATDEIMDILADINENGTAVLIVTHDAKVAARARRVLYMRDGNIVNELSLTRYDRTHLEQRTEQVLHHMKLCES